MENYNGQNQNPTPNGGSNQPNWNQAGQNQPYQQGQQANYQQPNYQQPNYQQAQAGNQGPQGYQQPQQGQAYQQPNAGQGFGQQQAGQNYQQGPASPKKSGNNEEIGSIVKETGAWIKAIFSADYTEAVDLAKKSKNQFSWALTFLVFFLLTPIVRLINYAVYANGYASAGDYVKTFFMSLLSALVTFALMAGILVVYQLIFKEFKEWYVPVNVAAVCLLPRVFILPVKLIFGSFSLAPLRFINNAAYYMAMIMTIALAYRFMEHNKDQKGAKWTMTGLIAAFFLIAAYL